MSGCAGCGATLPPNKAPGRQRKWCSERCRKSTLYGGTCVDCGATTDGSSGLNKASERCFPCNTRQRTKWTREAVIEAMCRWNAEHGRPPTATDWNATMSRECGRAHRGSDYPSTDRVQQVFGSWRAGLEAAGFEAFAPGCYGRDGEDPELCREYAERYMAGESTCAIAKSQGVPLRTAYDRVRRGGATLRSLKEARALRDARERGVAA